VPTDPADPHRPACPLPDGARADHPEFPVRNVEHVIGCRFSLSLYRKNKNVSPDPYILALFVACRIKLPGAEPPEHKLRMPLLCPALQEGRALHLNCRSIGCLGVEVIPADPHRALIANRPGDQKLCEDPARRVIAQVAERPPPEIRYCRIESCEPLAAVQWRRGRGDQPGWTRRLSCHRSSLRSDP
jgi:hypothetical protein